MRALDRLPANLAEYGPPGAGADWILMRNLMRNVILLRLGPQTDILVRPRFCPRFSSNGNLGKLRKKTQTSTDNLAKPYLEKPYAGVV